MNSFYPQRRLFSPNAKSHLIFFLKATDINCPQPRKNDTATLKYLALINIFKNYMFIKLLICKGSVTECSVYIVLDCFVILKV